MTYSLHPGAEHDIANALDFYSEQAGPAKTEDEPRFLVIGLINGKHWSAVLTYRGENIRLISVRRSRAEEVTLYES